MAAGSAPSGGQRPAPAPPATRHPHQHHQHHQHRIRSAGGSWPGRHLPGNRTQVTLAPSASWSGCAGASRNVMEPRIQGVLTPWNPDFSASGGRPGSRPAGVWWALRARRDRDAAGRGVADRSRAVSSGPGRGSVHDPAQPDRPGRRAAGQHGGREPRRGLRPTGWSSRRSGRSAAPRLTRYPELPSRCCSAARWPRWSARPSSAPRLRSDVPGAPWLVAPAARRPDHWASETSRAAAAAPLAACAAELAEVGTGTGSGWHSMSGPLPAWRAGSCPSAR